MKRALLGVLLLASISCGDLTRQGTSSSYLIVTALEGASGADPGEFGGTISSDVITVVDGSPTIFNDLGRVQFQLALKDPGPSSNPNTPTPTNAITVDRYRVKYVRSDNRNVEGADVPYTFDGAMTVTVSDVATASFTIVRNQAKNEAPLAALKVSSGILTTIAEVTFYGHDQTGREVSVVGKISITFANFGDPS